MTKLYAINNPPRSNEEIAAERVRRYRKKKFVESPALRAATIRESKGPKYFPVGWLRWWKAEIVRPEPGEVQRNLYDTLV